ncbi:MAG: Ig-like domain-containing protein [Oscillospiraceae bacterium]|nr:Ig-like domain-containing protein [Oscillospiraceae bacterium]
MKIEKKFSKVTAFLLIFAMIAGILPAFSLPVLAAQPNVSWNGNGNTITLTGSATVNIGANASGILEIPGNSTVFIASPGNTSSNPLTLTNDIELKFTGSNAQIIWQACVQRTNSSGTFVCFSSSPWSNENNNVTISGLIRLADRGDNAVYCDGVDLLTVSGTVQLLNAVGDSKTIYSPWTYVTVSGMVELRSTDVPSSGYNNRSAIDARAVAVSGGTVQAIVTPWANYNSGVLVRAIRASNVIVQDGVVEAESQYISIAIDAGQYPEIVRVNGGSMVKALNGEAIRFAGGYDYDREIIISGGTVSSSYTDRYIVTHHLSYAVPMPTINIYKNGDGNPRLTISGGIIENNTVINTNSIYFAPVIGVGYGATLIVRGGVLRNTNAGTSKLIHLTPNLPTPLPAALLLGGTFHTTSNQNDTILTNIVSMAQGYATESMAVRRTVNTTPFTYDAGSTLHLDTLPAAGLNATTAVWATENGKHGISYGRGSDMNFIEVPGVIVNSAPGAVNGVKLNKTTLNLKLGATEKLIATVTPTDATNQSVTWVVSGDPNDPSAPIVVAFDPTTGTVTASTTETGTSVITVTTDDGGFTASCTVTVSETGGSDNAAADGIDYSAADLIVPGSDRNFGINLTKETFIKPDDYDIKSFSIDGGTKWKAAKADTFSDAKLNKLFSKELNLRISDTAIDKATKQPGEGAVIVTFPKINKRPKIDKLVVNYAIGADASGATAGAWVLTVKDGSSSVKNDIEVGLASGKVLDDYGYGRFTGANGSKNGIAVQPLTGAKPAKTVYFIRNAAKQSGSVYTPASKARKINVLGEQKQPQYKVSKGIIKYKANTYTQPGSSTASLRTAKGEWTTAGEVTLWMAATAKKPASAKQTLTITAPASAP